MYNDKRESFRSGNLIQETLLKLIACNDLFPQETHSPLESFVRINVQMPQLLYGVRWGVGGGGAAAAA